MEKKHKAYIKLNIMSLFFVVVSFISITLAWFAYSGFASVETEVDVKAWYIDFKQGDELKQGDVFINVGNTKNLWVEAPLTEEQYAKVRQGQFVHYSVDDMDLTGTVLEVTHQDSEDEENKNLVTAAKISFPDELKDKVLPGADVTVQITIDR